MISLIKQNEVVEDAESSIIGEGDDDEEDFQ